MSNVVSLLGYAIHKANSQEANRQQTEMLLKGELEFQFGLMHSTDPTVRERARQEIERISVMLEGG